MPAVCLSFTLSISISLLFFRCLLSRFLCLLPILCTVHFFRGCLQPDSAGDITIIITYFIIIIVLPLLLLLLLLLLSLFLLFFLFSFLLLGFPVLFISPQVVRLICCCVLLLTQLLVLVVYIFISFSMNLPETFACGGS